MDITTKRGKRTNNITLQYYHRENALDMNILENFKPQVEDTRELCLECHDAEGKCQNLLALQFKVQD